MSWDAYNRLEVCSPFVLELENEPGRLLYFGLEHTACPQHPQLAELERRWEEFQPTVAYSEGGVWPLLSTREEAISKYGEGGLLRFLAQRDSIPVKSLEPPRADEVARLRQEYSAQCIKLYYFLRQVQQWQRNPSNGSPEEYLGGVLAALNEVKGLEGSPRTREELNSCCQEEFPELCDWRQVPARWFDPTQEGHLLNRLSRDCSTIRDQYMVAALAQEVRRGERVFAVVGYSHVVRQEGALRRALE